MIDLLPPKKVIDIAYSVASNCQKAPKTHCPALGSLKQLTDGPENPDFVKFVESLNRLLACRHAAEGKCVADDYLQNAFNRVSDVA